MSNIKFITSFPQDSKGKQRRLTERENQIREYIKVRKKYLEYLRDLSTPVGKEILALSGLSPKDNLLDPVYVGTVLGVDKAEFIGKGIIPHDRPVGNLLWYLRFEMSIAQDKYLERRKVETMKAALEAFDECNTNVVTLEDKG